MYIGNIALFLALACLAAAAPDDQTGSRAQPTLQARPIPAMTLQEALRYARKNQPSLLAARARLAGREAEARIPGALYYPRVAVTAQAFEGTANNTTAFWVGAGGVDLPRIGGTKVGTTGWDPSPSTLAAVGLRQELFDFGRIAALKAAANAAVEAERGKADATKLDVQFAVEDTFLAVQAAKGIRDAAESALQRSKLNHDTAVAGVQAQLRDPIELTRADADMGRFDVARIRAEAGLAAARSVFAAVVGVPDPTLDAAGGAPPLVPAPTLNDAVASALANDPLLREQRALVARQRANTRAIAAELRPDISLTATFSGRAGDALPSNGTLSAGGGWLPNIPNWDAGLVFTWPLLDLGVRAQEEASRALENARQSEEDETKQRLRASVQKAFVDLLAAQQAPPALEKSLAAARANYAQAEARFRAELGSSIELADAQALLAEAEVQLTVGRYQVLRARALLGRTIAEGL